MQEIRYDGTLGEKKEGTLAELMELTEESMEKESVAGVVLFKGDEEARRVVLNVVPGRKDELSEKSMEKIREIVKEEIIPLVKAEILLHVTRTDPTFKKFMENVNKE